MDTKFSKNVEGEHEVREKIRYRLVHEYNYPQEAIQYEMRLSYGKARYTPDIVVYSNNEPHIVVEIKLMGDLRKYRRQLQTYAEIIKPKYAILTNGITSLFFKVDFTDYQTELIQVTDIPAYGERFEDTGKNRRQYPLQYERFNFLIQKHLDLIQSQKYDVINSLEILLTIYVAKIFDEIKGCDRFKINYEENKNNTLNNINKIIDDVYMYNTQLIPKKIQLEDNIISEIVYDLQNTMLLESKELNEYMVTEIINKILEQKRQLEFITPTSLSSFIIEIINPHKGESVLDPACGIGGFLQLAVKRGAEIRGFDINSSVVQIANLCLILSGHSANCYNINSLSPRNTWGEDIQNAVKIEKFDVIVTSPPLNLELYDLEYTESNLVKGQIKMRAEALFFEVALKYLKEHGRGAIIVTPSFLFDNTMIEVRKFLLRNSKLKAIISLNNQPFAPLTTINADLIIFEKDREGTKSSDKVFISEVESVEDYTRIIENYRKYSAGEYVQEMENINLINISSADNLDYNYLKGKNLMGRITEAAYELGMIAEIITGTQLKRVDKLNSSTTYKYINAKNIQEGIINIEDAEIIPALLKANKYTTKQGDILISRVGSVGKIAIVNSSEKIIIGNNIIKITLNNKSVTPEYLFSYLISVRGQEQIKMYTRGTVIEAINSSDLRKIKIPIPTIDKVNQISEYVKKYLNLKTEESNLLKKIKNEQNSELEKIQKIFDRE